MPIELPEPTPNGEAATPPNPILWLTLLVAFLAVGATWTLFAWPKGQPTGTPWFWMQLLGYPFLAWGVLFGLRLHFYDEHRNFLAAREAVRQSDRDEAIAFGAEPLAVLGAVYLCAMAPSGASTRIANRESAVRARTPKPHLPVNRHTRLAFAEDGNSFDRYREAFEALLAVVEAPLRALPPKVPFDVQLQLPGDVEPGPLLAAWQTCWRRCGLLPAEVALVPAGEGLMMLDAWLDEYGGPALERFTLFVAVQLHDTPPEGSGEAAVALLLGWAPLVKRRGLVPVAMMHRPVACDIDGIAGAIEIAALCGRASPKDLLNLWQSGLSKADKTDLLMSASDVALGAAVTDGLIGVHDIDSALGNLGVAGPWFATALAIEHAQGSNAPQLIACRENALRLAVVRPVADQIESETT